ncbi:MAG: DUF1643 domain-containing protein [Mycoplasmoidaceae bacterium]|nr:MAG: DUF1643 domain-containing protein [Mycoplasmoidaceae bacterium]
MNNKITKRKVLYPNEEKPTFTIPETYESYRYALGKTGSNPLLFIGMNPSAAKFDSSDSTVNTVIRISKFLNKDGWVMLNLYPERSTDAKNLCEFNLDLMEKNIEVINNMINKYKVNEIMLGWGDQKNNKTLQKAKEILISEIKRFNVKLLCFYNSKNQTILTSTKNPRHPLYKKIEKKNFSYININNLL